MLQIYRITRPIYFELIFQDVLDNNLYYDP